MALLWLHLSILWESVRQEGPLKQLPKKKQNKKRWLIKDSSQMISNQLLRHRIKLQLRHLMVISENFILENNIILWLRFTDIF